MKYLLLITALLATNAANSQDLLYEMQPTCNNEERLASSLAKYARQDDQFLYVLHFKPNSCPRCEGIMLNIAQAASKKSNVIAIVDGTNSKSGESYVKNFKVDYISASIYDEAGAFRQYIDYQRTNLNVPYVYKINVKTGQFLNITPTLGVNANDKFINSILTDNSVVDCINSTQEVSKNTQTAVAANRFWDEKIAIKNDVKFPFSDPAYFSVDSNLYFIDYANQLLYEVNRKGDIVSLIHPNDDEYYTYGKTDLQKSVIRDLKDKMIARVIYLNVSRNPTGKFDIIASLPKVTVDIKDNDTSIGYFNEAVRLTKSSADANVAINGFNIPGSSEFIHSHSQYRPYYDQKMYSLAVYKGWPATGTTAEPTDSASNPFLPGFYDNAPIIKVYSDNNQPIGVFGSLPKFYKEKQLGYYYLDFDSRSNSKYLYILSRATGELQLVKNSDVMNGKNVFKTVSLLPEKDKTAPSFSLSSFDSKLKYIQAYRSHMYGQYIDAFTVTDENIYIVIRNNAEKKLIVKKLNVDGTKVLATETLPMDNPDALVHLTIDTQNSSKKKLELFGIQKENDNFLMGWHHLNLN